MPPAFLDIPRARLSREGVVREVAGEIEVLAVATPDGVRVYNGMCPHLGGPLLEGRVADGIVHCPWHGYAFDLGTARCLTAPGGPWRSLVGGAPHGDEPLEIELLPLDFEEHPDRIRVRLGGPAQEEGGSP